MITIPGSDLDLSSLALPQAAQNEANKELGQEDFLMLMITQFENQDPFEPLDNGEFIGQMAQFSTVSGITEMNQSMQSLAESMYANQALQASTMVGRTVLADGDLGTMTEDKPLKGGVDLPFANNSAFVRVYDGAGQVVREIGLGPRNRGLATFEWDGQLADGTQAPSGTYRITAGMANGDEEIALATYVGTKVQSVTLSAGGAGAEITTEGGQRVSLSQIKAIM